MINHQSSRRNFLKKTSMVMAGIPFVNTPMFPRERQLQRNLQVVPDNKPLTVLTDNKVQFDFGKERMIWEDGLQPSMLVTQKNTIVVQVQNRNKPLPQERIYYPFALDTVVSRDKGNTWEKLPLLPGKNDINIEGGIIQLKDGTILGLETYVTPGNKPDTGETLLFYSKDDMKTIEGPFTATFEMPDANFYASSDDGGRPHVAMRLHRRIIELPNGDLMTTIYGWQKGDKSPSDYEVRMIKTRVMVFRSSNKGRHWKFVSAITTVPQTQTEGFGEPVLNRVSKGKHAGRLICFIRTGRELYRTHSDNEGKTWTAPAPIQFADRDVYATEKWRDMFKDVKRKGQLVTESSIEIIGAVVDPDICVLRSGLLVAAFGLRIPAKACWQKFNHPWNGNYMAVSSDGGDTWGNVQQLTSGIPTTHYMAIEEMKEDNTVFVVYDWGWWGYKEGRFTYGRPVTIRKK